MNRQETKITCEDGFVLNAFVYVSDSANTKKKVLIINSATAVSQELYRNYALFMAKMGFEVITFDYRGIAGSRPKQLRGFQASFTEWGEKDVSAVLNYAKKNYPDCSILVLGHSIGGTLIGMTSYASKIDGIINIGAQTAYFKDWGRSARRLYAMWHVLFPGLTKVIGYFPGKRLGLLEDIPKGVVDQWHARRKNPDMVAQLGENGIQVYYNQFKGKLLTLVIADDPIGTLPAILRIHDIFTNADKVLETVHPRDIGVTKIGHFGFFSRKFKTSLWEKTAVWFDEV